MNKWWWAFRVYLTVVLGLLCVGWIMLGNWKAAFGFGVWTLVVVPWRPSWRSKRT